MLWVGSFAGGSGKRAQLTSNMHTLQLPSKLFTYIHAQLYAKAGYKALTLHPSTASCKAGRPYARGKKSFGLVTFTSLHISPVSALSSALVSVIGNWIMVGSIAKPMKA